MTIPSTLIDSGLAFVKLGYQSKRPMEKNWVNIQHTAAEIEQWLARGNNYGVLCGVNDLIVVDVDSPDLIDTLAELPPTFTCRTPKKGIHLYYFCPDFGKKIVLAKDGKHLGEILGKGAQAVGPGSVHPDTKTPYLVEKDLPIAQLEKSALLKAIGSLNSATGTTEKSGDKKEHDKLIQSYGCPIYFDKSGRAKDINESFWAGLHHLEHEEFYEPNEKVFCRYDETNGLYRLVTEDRIKQEISSRILDASRDISQPLLSKTRKNSILTNIVAQLRGICEKEGAFQKSENYVHLKNGVVAFEGSTHADFYAFSPDFISRNGSPFGYDPKASCPKFKEFLSNAVSHDDALLLQKYAGMCLLGKNLVQRLMVLDGLPGRGKSMWSLVIQGLIGLENVTELRTANLAERFELARYQRKNLLVGVDVRGDFLVQRGSHMLKGLVGGDNFDAEMKNSNGSFRIKGQFCVLITSNSKLRVHMEGDLGAWKRRLLIVSFQQETPPKKIPDYDKMLLDAEGSGILNWALEGLALLLKDIENYGDVALTNEQASRVDRLLAESDSLCNFLKDRVKRDFATALAVSEIIEEYGRYCLLHGWTPKPYTTVRGELQSLMLEMFGVGQSHSVSLNGLEVRGYRNVGFK